MIKNPIPWPNGARCAVAFTWDVDADATVHVNYPDSADNHVATLSLMRYDPEIAIPRIIDLFGRYTIPLTFFVPGWTIENYPAAIELMLKNSHEIAHHGYLHHDNNRMSRQQELDILCRGIEIIKEATGRKPLGYRTPNVASNGVSRNTIDLLMQEGFEYDSSLFGDDIPYVLSNERGKIIEIPCLHGVDDWKYYMSWQDFDYRMQVLAPVRAIEIFKAEFDAAWEYGGMWMCVWHPPVSGRLARCAALEPLIRYMQDKGDVWFASMGDIAAHVNSVIQSGHWKPRIDKLPYCVSPIPALKDYMNL
ncbi:polysaccharide deacetylase family protein [Microvirga zambiensis]|uniref:polysaccharide deacetylase family protein n=1 Tax=Microvirga zambiensis TaxID=1402137 RepID=UPI00191D064F|nr:polysaccharide deacetylase [Microvirga zambiensis]